MRNMNFNRSQRPSPQALAWSMVICGVLVIVFALTGRALAADVHVGTWKLNVAKSKYSPGPAPKSGTLKIEAIDNGLKFTLDAVDADGKSTRAEFSPKFDGKDYPAKGLPNADTISLKRIDANTTEAAAKNGGKVTMTVRSVVSTDGKTRTSTQTGKDEKGRDVNNTVVYDRQ